jgi:quercetin dioxygenase-like cupin family protein/DNA-binding XRE family transcriptional regulator
MEPKINEIAKRIKVLRDIFGYSVTDMSQALGVSEQEYVSCEEGKQDFSFTFLYKCAEKFGVDLIEILTGENPHLKGYTIVRGGKGLMLRKDHGFDYFHLAANFKHKIAEPFLVRATFREEEQNQKIELTTHAGQEFDYILSGTLHFAFEDHIEVMREGDSVYYNSGRPHGMIAAGGQDCLFLAVVMKEQEECDS